MKNYIISFKNGNHLEVDEVVLDTLLINKGMEAEVIHDSVGSVVVINREEIVFIKEDKDL